MNTRTTAWSVAALVLAIASGAGAQPLPLPPPPDVAPAVSAPTAASPAPRAAQPQPNALPPAEIVASVRSAGFDPLSRPVRRGSMYVVFARDRYLMDVQVKIDARSGRVLSATRLAGTAYGGPGYEAYDRRRYEPAPVPPGEIPSLAPRRPPGPVAIEGGRRSTERPAPLPRARPDEVVTGEVKDAAPPVRPDAPAAAANPPAAAAKRQPAPPPQPVMVPVAPLE